MIQTKRQKLALQRSKGEWFIILDSDKNGTVDLAELEEYVSTYGLVANLNVVPQK